MPSSHHADWPAVWRVAFRFVFAYLVLYLFPFPIDLIPLVADRVVGAWETLWRAVTPPVGQLVGVPVLLIPANGSGDGSHQYVRVLCFAIIAAVTSVIWTWFARRREYDELHDWLRAYVRFALASIMLWYGVMKIFQLQFPDSGPSRLTSTFGESSPMGLLWTFMAASPLYQVFAGASETIGGLFLFFRRTTTLGALLLVAVMGNVVMLNLSYDVPVKLFAINLWLMALFLLVPDLPRLTNVFVLNRATAPVPARPLPPAGWKRYLYAATVAILVVESVRNPIVASITRLDDPRARWSMNPLTGLYVVESGGVPTTWERVTMDALFTIRSTDGTTSRFRLATGPEPGGLILGPYQTGGPSYPLSWEQIDDRIVLRGTIGENKVDVRLRKTPTPTFLLQTRGFRWIQEYPFNR